jgi:glycosyltransferase involved in cell wall biosynthesis
VNRKPAKPRLLVLTSTFPRWLDDPEPAFVFELSRRLTDAFEVTVLSPRAPGSPRHETMDGLRVLRFPYFISRWEHLATHGGGILGRLRANRLNYLIVPFFLLGQLWALVRLLRRERFAAIHAHWLIPQGLVAVAARILARRFPPLICTSHGADLFALRGPLWRGLKRGIIGQCQALTVVSSAMRTRVIEMGVAPNKVTVISMGADLQQRFTPDRTVERAADELLFVGRLVEKKGLDVLLAALPMVQVRYPGIRLIVAGSGPLSETLCQQAKTLSIADQITFLGMITQAELPARYRRATLCIAPFRVADSGDQEGLGLVLVEALGCGCPVIASDLPAVRDVICDGESGLLVPPSDPQALAVAICRLLNDPERRHALAARGQRHCREHFDWSSIAERYTAWIADAIRQR